MADKNEREVDELSGTQTTGHEWDGIKELDTPMPRWWVWTFYATIIFAIGYCIYYPAIPMLETATRGVSGITARGQVEQVLEDVKKSKTVLENKLVKTALADVNKDENLYRFATAGGQSLYKVYCSQCHGSGAQGAAGYPNLNDDDWLWGGDVEAIRYTIAHGVRHDPDENTRVSEMPAFGRDELLEKPQIKSVVEYVLKISNQEHNEAEAKKGEVVYAENCAACHGENGKGGREFGAPNLADALALYGISREDLTKQIKAPRHGVMPAWIDRLGEAGVRQLALYVHSLGGGEKPKPKEE